MPTTPSLPMVVISTTLPLSTLSTTEADRVEREVHRLERFACPLEDVACLQRERLEPRNEAPVLVRRQPSQECIAVPLGDQVVVLSRAAGLRTAVGVAAGGC